MDSSTTKRVVAGAVVAGLREAAAKPGTALQSRDIHAVEAAVTEKVAPIVQHATNTEDHWFQKRSFWSAIVSGVMVVAAPLALRYGLELGEEERELVIGGLTTLGGLWASYLAYRAGTAKKPLGQ